MALIHRRPLHEGILLRGGGSYRFGLENLTWVETASERFATLETEVWLGRQDSNLRMAAPKAAALPLGDAPTCPVGARAYNGARGSAKPETV
jgi:hypothetical protein